MVSASVERGQHCTGAGAVRGEPGLGELGHVTAHSEIAGDTGEETNYKGLLSLLCFLLIREVEEGSLQG